MMGVRGLIKLKVLSTLLLLGLILSNGMLVGVNRAFAQVEPPDVEVINPYFTLTEIEIKDGRILERATISGPPNPLAEFEAERQASIQPLPITGILPRFPSYSWVFGCSAVSGAMIAGYYDNNGYPDMYAGPTNGGVMPQSDTYWPTWSDGSTTYPNNPLIASHNGVGGRTTKGSIDDYWVNYGSTANDPYITGGWAQHTWSDAIGDYMKTSQSVYENTDGSTHFYNWNDTAPDPTAQLTCTQMEGYEIDHLDGTYGRKLFYEARGYSVGDCYNQNTDNNFAGGFSLADFKAEIDAGNPVLLNLAGHSIVGYGYSGSTIYIRDTWDNDPSHTYTMPWGGSYDGMELYSVSVVHLNPAVSPAIPSAPTGVAASDGTQINQVGVSWNVVNGATYYKIFRNINNNHIGETEISVSHAPDKFNDFTAEGDVTYYYWVKACNSAGCSDYSACDSGYRTTSYDLFLPIVMKQEPAKSILNGDFEQGRVAWTEYSSGNYILIMEVSSGAHSGSWIAWLGGYDNAVDQLYQDVTITASEPYLHFYGWIDSEDLCNYDYFFLVFGGDLVGYVSLCADNNTGGWVHFIADMSDYIGSTDTLLFDVETNGSGTSNFYLDTVYLSATGPSSSSSSILIEGTYDVFEPKPLLKGDGFKQKDINR